MIEVFGMADFTVTRSQVSNWLKKEEDPVYESLSDAQLAIFLNGFIIDKRGKKDGPQPEPEIRLTNNIIFRKLKIALNFKDDDIVAIFKLVDIRIGKSELTSFFRNPKSDKYRECKDQFLRNFLYGIEKKYRVDLKKKK